jgi:hypothetical protein
MALWRDFADTLVARVTHDDITFPIHCDSEWREELSNGTSSVSMALFASARQSGHLALWCDFADTVVARVSHDDVPVPIHCDSEWREELSNGTSSVSMALLASACQSGHCHLAPCPFHLT